MAAIPLSWNDPMFNGVTSSGSVILRDGGTVSNKSITDTGDLASVVGYGSFTVDGVRINSGEGVRIGGSGDIKINNSYIETKGKSGASHSDGIQAYDPGGTGNVKITNTTIVSHNDNATAGMFVADDYNGTFTFDNVVFKGGPFGLRINADDKDLSVSLKDVYFVGPFEYNPLLFQKVNADIHITQWDNVRYATIVNGELVPGNLIKAPFAVEGGTTAPSPAPAPAPDTTTTSPTPTSGKIIESAGATSLVESGDKYYLNSSSGSGPSLKVHGVAFVDGTDGTWAPIGAEKTTTGYQVAWKEASTGLYTAWNTDNNGNYVSHVSTLTGSTSGGVVSGTNSGLKSLETSFHQDLNGDGQIGASSAAAPTVATSGQTIVGTNLKDTLTSTTGNDIMVGNGGSDTFVFADNFGNDTIKDFEAKYAVGWRHDTIQFSKSVFDDFASMQSHASQVGQDVVISTGSNSLTLKNATLSGLDHYDFHFA